MSIRWQKSYMEITGQTVMRYKHLVYINTTKTKRQPCELSQISPIQTFGG